MYTQLGEACRAFKYLFYVEGNLLIPNHIYDFLKKEAKRRGDTELDKINSDKPEDYSTLSKMLADLFRRIGTNRVLESIQKNEKLDLTKVKAY